MRLEECHPDHLKTLTKQYSSDPRLGNAMLIASLLRKNLVYTIFEDEEIVAVFGALKIWEGVGEVIFYKTPLYSNKVTPYTRIVSKTVDLIQEKGKFHRLQAVIGLEDSTETRFVKFFGFTLEAVLHHFGPHKEDYGMFTRCRF